MTPSSPFQVVSPPPLSVVIPVQDTTHPPSPPPLTTSNMVSYDNEGLVTTPPSPGLLRHSLSLFAPSPLYSDNQPSPTIPTSTQVGVPLSTRDGSLLQMGHSNSMYINSEWDHLVEHITISPGPRPSSHLDEDWVV